MSIANNTILLISNHINFQDQVLQAILVSDLAVCDLAVSIQVVKQVTQAWDYLTGIKFYSDRERYPLPVLVLIDIDIPGLSALDLLRWINQHPKLKDIPVIAVGSAINVNKVRQVYCLDEKSYFVKGTHFEVLIHLVKTRLGLLSKKHADSFLSDNSWRLKRQPKNNGRLKQALCLKST